MQEVVVNGRFLTQPVTGVQRFARELVARLGSIRHIRVVVPRGTPTEGLGNAIDVVEYGRLRSHAWEQIDLPRYLRRHGDPLLVGLSNTGPVRYHPQIITHHDVSYLRHPDTYSRAFTRAYQLLARHTLPLAERVITVSDFSRSEISEAYAIPTSQIDILSPGVSTQLMMEPIDEDHADERSNFLAVGSLLPHKNIGLLLDAYAAYRAEHPQASRLCIVGSVPSMGRSSDAIKGGDGVDLLGRVDDAMLAQLYRSSRALVFPSLYEGFGIPPIEAQILGCPVIASDAEAMREVLRDSAYFFDRHSVVALQAALTSVDNDAALRRTLTARGLENASRYSWDSSAELLGEIIDDVLRARAE